MSTGHRVYRRYNGSLDMISMRVGYIKEIVESWKVLNAFYLDHHKVRASKKIHLQMILPIDALKQAKERKKIGYFDYRFMDIKDDGEFGIYENFIVIQYTSKKEKNPRGFLIKDKIFVETFKGVFNKLWNIAKP